MILALDIAAKTGWACPYASGVWDIKRKQDESSGMKLIRFRAKLKEIFSEMEPDIIVFERLQGKHVRSLCVQAEMHGIMKAFCNDHGIEYKAYSAGEIKKHATGKGNANKEDMTQAARLKWPNIDIIDDNQADALWLLDLAEKDLAF